MSEREQIVAYLLRKSGIHGDLAVKAIERGKIGRALNHARISSTYNRAARDIESGLDAETEVGNE